MRIRRNFNQQNQIAAMQFTLKPADTIVFKNTGLDTKVQVKFYMKDGTIAYSDVYDVEVVDSLDANGRGSANKNTMIAGLAGFGYTED